MIAIILLTHKSRDSRELWCNRGFKGYYLRQSQLMSMQSEYQSEIQDYQDNEATYSDLVKQDKIAEIQGLEQRIGTFQQSAQESLQRKEVELLSPILEKLQNAINEVAEDGDYTYIFDNNTGGMLLYSKESENISSLVKKKLGL